MAEKISTVVLKVDLDCERCYKKIRKVLCKLQDKENIKTISFDEKSKTVTISGPFDPEKICKKLCCEAGKVVREMQIKGKDTPKPKDGQKPAEKEAKQPEKASKPAEKEGKQEKKVRFEEAEPDPKPKAKQAAPQGDHAAVDKVTISKMEPEPPRGEPMAMVMPAQGMAMPSIWPPPAAGPVCCYRPAYETYYGGGCRCYSCGKVAGWGGAGAPPAGGYYGVPVYDQYGYNRQPYGQPFSYEEDPNAGCSIM